MKKKRRLRYAKCFGLLALSLLCVLPAVNFCGCRGLSGYSDESLYPQNVESVCLKMFENETFRRGIEYELTDALSKRIEAQTPYKIVSSMDRADTVMSGKIISVVTSVLTAERETGRALEKEVGVVAVVKWKNLRTGELLMDSVSVSAAASFSEWQNQGFSYASTLAANKVAQKIVEQMEKKW